MNTILRNEGKGGGRERGKKKEAGRKEGKGKEKWAKNIASQFDSVNGLGGHVYLSWLTC